MSGSLKPRSENPLRAFVTGGGRGIGRATALALAKAGWDVGITWRMDEQSANKTVDAIRRTGQEAFSVRLLLGERASARGAVRMVTEEFGGLALLVNNAGMLVQKPWRTITDAEWDETMSVNLRGTFQLCQEAFPLLEKSSGSIVNMTSVGGQTGGILAIHYAASKAAVIGLTRSLARLGAPRVRVNAVAPGLIETEMTAAEIASDAAPGKLKQILLGRVGTPEEVADAIVFLASPAAAYITGQIIGVNGGSHFG